jgi:hypothetical protein
MAGEKDLVTQLAAVIAALDDDALATLASKGLLRRAEKDLAQGSMAAVERQTDSALVVRVGDALVMMPAQGPAAATCSCRALTTCRHVLAAALYLRSWFAERSIAVAPAPPPAEAARAELLKLSADSLRAWAGAKAFRDAVRLVAGGLTVLVTEHHALVLYVPTLDVECRYLPGGGLDGVITNASSRDRAKVIVAVVLAFQQANGVALDTTDAGPSSLPEAVGAPRSRGEVIGATRALLEEMVRAGLAHPSSAIRDRLATLAVSATGANLPRLALGIRALADEVTDLVTRSAQADPERLFSSVAQVYALAAALSEAGPSPPADLIGWHRTHYDTIARLEVVGVGAYPWRTRSGFDGLSVVFWDERGRRWLTWSDSRPRSAGFDPVRRYRQLGPWGGSATPETLSRRRVHLLGARRNSQDRLSGSAQCQAQAGEPARPDEIDFGPHLFRTWADLRRHAASIYPVGLKEHQPLDRLVVLQPATWVAPGFDQAAQASRWLLLDADRQPLVAELRYSDQNRLAIEMVERFDPTAEGAWGLLAEVLLRPGPLVVTPLTVFRKSDGQRSAIVNLGLDNIDRAGLSAPEQAPVPAPSNLEPLDALDGSDTPELVPLPAAMEREVAGLEDELQHHAECGCRMLTAAHQSRLAERSALLRRHGLRLLADQLDCFAVNPLVTTLVRLRYLCLLHRQAAVRAGIG